MQVELEQLLILQERDQQMRQLETELKNTPLQRKALDAQAQAAAANLETLKQRARQLEVEKKKLELEVGTRNESINRLRAQQYETRKNDEFAAMGREIERYQTEISALEDQELNLMEQADQLKAQLAGEEKQTADAQASIARQVKDLDSKEATLSQRVAELKKQREAFAEKIEEDLMDRYRRLFASKGDAAVVALEHDVCAGCHMKVTTATAMRVKSGKEIVSCEQCGRILYSAD